MARVGFLVNKVIMGHNFLRAFQSIRCYSHSASVYYSYVIRLSLCVTVAVDGIVVQNPARIFGLSFRVFISHLSQSHGLTLLLTSADS
jgi:hypothetical protein